MEMEMRIHKLRVSLKMMRLSNFFEILQKKLIKISKNYNILKNFEILIKLRFKIFKNKIKTKISKFKKTNKK